MADAIAMNEDAFLRTRRAVRAFESDRLSASSARHVYSPTRVKVVGGPVGSYYLANVGTTSDAVTYAYDPAVVYTRALNGEYLLAGDNYRADLVGYAADGTPILEAIVTCCPGPVASSGSSGSGIVVPCCPGVLLPTTLYARVTNGGSCNGTYRLDYSGGNSSTWATTYVTMGACTGGTSGYVSFSMICNNSGQWYLVLSAPIVNGSLTGSTANGIRTSFDCSAMVWVYTVPADSACGCTNPITITVTATNPGDGGIPSGCAAGNCGDAGVSTTLSATVGNRAGTYATLPASFSMGCVSEGAGLHGWLSGSNVTCNSTTGAPSVAQGGSAGAYVPALFLPGDGGGTVPDAGWVCSPHFAAVYHVGSGPNTCTVTVTGS